jgi:hypothetical protein
VKTKLQKNKLIGHGAFMMGTVPNKRHLDECNEIFSLKCAMHVLPSVPQIT